MRVLFASLGLLLVFGRAAAQPSAALEPELGLRLAEAEAEVAALELRYGPRHPQLLEARRRVLYLRQGAQGTVAAPGAREALQGKLLQLLATLGVQRAELAKQYAARNPRLVELGRRLAVVERHLIAAGGSTSASQPSSSPVPQLIVRRAEAEGRLAFLTSRYRDRHPAVVATRAALDAARAALEAQGPLSAADRAEARRLLIEALAQARGRRQTSSHGRGEVGELEAVLDAVAVQLARLGPIRSCPCPEPKPLPRGRRLRR